MLELLSSLMKENTRILNTQDSFLKCSGNSAKKLKRKAPGNKQD